MTRLRTIAACDAAAAEQFAPWKQATEDRAVEAWIAVSGLIVMPTAELRQERRALFEMRDMIDRALKATAA